MDEPKPQRIRVSVATKLLISIGLLLLIVVGFLSTSATVLVSQDKRLNSFRMQSTEASFAGREFSDVARQTIDTLRIYMASIQPTAQVPAPQLVRLQGVIDNQTFVLSVQVKLLNLQTNEISEIARSVKKDAIKNYDMSADVFELKDFNVKQALPQLLSNSFYFFNMSKYGNIPLLGVALADLQFKDNPAGLPVAIAAVSLVGFGKDVKSSGLTLANREGNVLFSSDPEVLFSHGLVTSDSLFQSALSSKVASSTHEYISSGIRYLGGFSKPGFGLVVLTKITWAKAMRATYLLVERFVLLGLLAVSGSILFSIAFSKTMTAPIKRLFDATETIGQGNFDIVLESKNNDEIGSLTRSFVSMSKKIQALILDSIRKAHLESELAIVSAVQQTLIPASEFENENVTIFGHYQPAAECGGDWWGHFMVGKKMCFMIADATGHGLPSALITASARSCFSVLQKLAEDETFFQLSPKEMMSFANRAVYEAASGKIMMTLFIGVCDFEAGQITYASAGHNPPWLFKKTGDKYVLESLMADGMRLGDKREPYLYEEKSMPIAKDDLLFLYTDGVMEGMNLSGVQYGKKKTRKLVESALGRDPKNMVNVLVDDVMLHNTGKPLDDDITVVVVKFT